MSVAAPGRAEAPTATEPSESGTERKPLGDFLLYVVLIALSLVGALGLAAIVLVATGYDAGSAFSEMWSGSFGSKDSFFTTLNHTAPILIVAIGACIAGRGGLINIGFEGQFLVGGLGACAVATKLDAPSIVILPLTFVAGIVAAALWAGIAAVLKYTRGVNEVVSTLLLNFVAFQLAGWVLARQYLLQSSGRIGEPSSVLRAESDLIHDSAQLPFLSQGLGFLLEFTIAIAVPVALVAAFLLARTRWGFNLRASGLNPRAARRFGVNVSRVGGTALVVSGALAGLAGAAFLTGGAYRVTPGFASDYGWEGLLAGLVAGFRPMLAIPVALLYGAVRAGGGLLTASGVSTNLTGIVQALIVVAVTLPALYMHRRDRVRQMTARQRT